MIWMLRILLILCALTSAAHFVRMGNLWTATAVASLALAVVFPRGLPRPVLILAALTGAFFWADQCVALSAWRIHASQPWMRLASILAALSLTHFLVAVLLCAQAGRRLFGALDSTAWTRTGAFILVAGILWLARTKTSLPLLLGERFFPDSGPFWIWGFAVYGALVVGWLLDGHTPLVRRRIWVLFSAVFFAQLILGLSGWGLFLMTGELHLPVPALILSGPIFRGAGFFMPLLLGATLLLVGPAWCSYLCYIGAWDDHLAQSVIRPKPLPAWAPFLRAGLLIVAVLTPLWLRGHDPSWFLSYGLLFGLTGVGVMFFWSRRTGTMAHCTSFCPIGLVNSLAGRLLPWRIHMDKGCTQCGLCTRSCRYNALTEADLANRRPGLTCTLCGDCLPHCPHGHLRYGFPGLNPAQARQVFFMLVASLHSVFLAVARI